MDLDTYTKRLAGAMVEALNATSERKESSGEGDKKHK